MKILFGVLFPIVVILFNIAVMISWMLMYRREKVLSKDLKFLYFVIFVFIISSALGLLVNIDFSLLSSI